jgi:hypothetical protein
LPAVAASRAIARATHEVAKNLPELVYGDLRVSEITKVIRIVAELPYIATFVQPPDEPYC